MTRRKKLGVAALVLLVVIAGMELFCRFYLGLGDPPLSRADPEIEYMFVGPRTYHRFGNTIAYNSFAMRSREFDPRRNDPAEIRIVVVGDSVINGGAQTDQSQLMTTLLENHLHEQFHRPAVVMNVSAGSWGPPNYLAYIKRYGFFEADALVIVVSTHDFADSPTFAPVVGVDPDYPARTPPLALWEALTRYAPRYLPHWGAAPLPPTQGQIDQAMGAFRELIRMAQERKIPIVVAQHLEQPEYGQPEAEGHRMFREACDELHVARIEWAPAFEAEMKAGHSPYRDGIHPNAHGQELMEKAIYPEVAKVLQK